MKKKWLSIWDPNHNDLDDEASAAALKALIDLGHLDFAGAVSNTNPEYQRTRVARGLFDFLGLKELPIAVGLRVMLEPDPCPDLDLITYLAPDGTTFEEGKTLILRVLTNAKVKEIVLVVQAAMSEVKWLLEEHRQLFCEKVDTVVFMGGVMSELSPEGYILPGDAMNVHFDDIAAKYSFKVLQDLGIPMVITTRNATFKALLSHDIFDKMGELGKCFASRVNKNTQRFWRSCCAPEGSVLRGKLSISRNREWFVKVFCGGINPPIPDDGDILPYVLSKSWPQYDAINLIASVPELRERFFVSKKFEINGSVYEVIGWSSDEHGLRDPNEFVTFLEELLIKGSR